MQVVSVKAATDVDFQTFVKGDDPNKLPSLLKITQSEITIHDMSLYVHKRDIIVNEIRSMRLVGHL